MKNIDNSPLIRRAVAVAEVLQELTTVQLGANDLFGTYPRDLRPAYEAGLCLCLVPIAGLFADKALRYVQMLELNSDSEDYEDGGIGDEDWVAELPHTPLDAYLYVGPPQSTLFYERGLSPARANFALAYELGGYLADLMSYRCLWTSPRSVQCASVWDAVDPDLAQHQLWFDLRVLPRLLMPQGPDCPKSVLDLAMPYPTLYETIARELLAPWAEVSVIFCEQQPDRHAMVSVLMDEYGLPAAVSARYCNDLWTLLPPRPVRSCSCQSAPTCSLPSPDSPLTMQNLHWGDEAADESE